MKIGIYKSKSKAERNRGYSVLYAYDTDWPLGTIRHRGLAGGLRFVRPAFDHEVECRNRSNRAVSYKYKNIRDLLEDERLAGCGESVISKISEALEG